MIPDAVQCLEPDEVKIAGWLGGRIDANLRHRLAVTDTAPLLACYQQRPGKHSWIGEHVGKWLHAATLAWVYSSDPGLRKKLDDVVLQLVATQEADGYLGTYTPDKRFSMQRHAEWDVWSHKYNLIGLVTYYRYTGNPAALAAARRAADLLIQTFPAQRSIVDAGSHRGMAATSVLEPIILLYRLTGDVRYLDFARYVVSAYDDPRGPGIVRSLQANQSVTQTANAKAYEMLSNLVGLCEFARYTGNRDVLTAVTAAWRDIVEHQLYITGSCSVFEHFVMDHALPNDTENDIGETCVTVTWLQLNTHLLRLTGDARYADEIERSLYNHLAAAQAPSSGDWCYYTALAGTKRFDSGTTCCHSSGPRGFALAPTMAFLRSNDAIYINTPETASARVEMAGATVELRQSSGFPRDGHTRISIHTTKATRFALRVRASAWAVPLRAGSQERNEAGWLEIPIREWRDGDSIDCDYTLTGRAITGSYGNYGQTAFAWGPFVLAIDQNQNPKERALAGLRAAPTPAPVLVSADGPLLFSVQGHDPWDDFLHALTLQPFADVGAGGSLFRVWLRTNTP